MTTSELLHVPRDVAADAQSALNVALLKVGALIKNHPGLFPVFTKNGQWKHGSPAWTNWCEGFLGGQLWIFADQTQESRWRDSAVAYSRALRGREFDPDVHDLGFIFWPTWRKWYQLCGDLELDEVVVQAGRTMGLRFNERAGFLRSFLADDSTFIDIMMNVGIIHYAAERDGDDVLAAIVQRHCMNTRRHLLRGDGSAAHEGIFDPVSGEFIRQSTQQGWRSDSSWARGQAWALYGFGTMYAFTRVIEYLDTAKALADYFIDRTGDVFVPPNDWDEPHPTAEFESSAAAITASGLLQLAALVEDATTACSYRDYAFGIVRRLCSPDFLASDDPQWEGILKHGSYHEQLGLGVDESVMWGEYFFVEVLDKCLGGRWVSTEF